VARLFFALPASKGFLLAGGGALLAQHLTSRPTEDLDFFTSPERGHVQAARNALETAARHQSWSVEQIHDSGTFCRIVIRSSDAGVLVDLAVNAPPDLPASVTSAGPTRRFGKNAMLARAESVLCRFLDGCLPLRAVVAEDWASRVASAAWTDPVFE
jgi:hypothetical protein